MTLGNFWRERERDMKKKKEGNMMWKTKFLERDKEKGKDSSL